MSHRALTEIPRLRAVRGQSSAEGWRGLSRRLRLWLIDYLAAGLQEPEAARNGPGAECLDQQDFEDRLRTLFAGRTHALAGRLHFVNLAELHAFYGARWPAVSISIFRIVSRIIEENIGPEDFFARTGDAYMIVFPDLTPDEAELQCARIAVCIRTALVAAYPEAPPFEVRHVTDVIDGALKLSHTPVTEPAAGRSGDAHTAMGQSPAVPDVGSIPEFNYRPIWNTRIRQVSSYACLPAEPLQTIDARDRAELDRRCLDKIIGDSSLLMLVEGRNTNLFFPVHFGTLMDPKLRSLFDNSAKAVPAGLKDRLVAEVIDLPAALERAEVMRLKATLGGVAHAMVARVPLGITRFHHLKTAGFASVGLDISTYVGPEAKVQSLLDDHVVEANKLSLKTYIHGLRSISMITYAVCAGFDHIDGQPISSFDTTPNDIYPLDPKHLYAHLLVEKDT